MNLYIHIPFCTGKCAYCAFYSERYESVKAARYLTALEAELVHNRPLLCAIETIYIGGGTPSTLSVEQWQQLAAIIKQNADISSHQEWTVEANPGAVTPELASLWQDVGVTRISLGVQSMNDVTLARIGRPHSRHDVIDTVTSLRSHGFSRIGLDLIAGLPGVSDSEWNQTLGDVLALEPDHLSCYACSVDPGSRFHKWRANPRYHPANETSMLAALDHAETILSQAAFEHYEISNYAKPGQRCRHNTHIWSGADYLGVGPAAASRIGPRRWINAADLDAYTAAPGEPPRETEQLSAATDTAERLAFHFRLADPISLDAVVDQFGSAARHLRPYWEQQLTTLAQNGLLVRIDNCWKTTPRGSRLADIIAEALLPTE